MDYQNFLNSFFESFKLDLKATEKQTSEGVLFDITGGDARLLLSENGELLDALEHILFQVYGRDLPREQRFICDADGYRQTRRAGTFCRKPVGQKSARPPETGAERENHYQPRHLRRKIGQGNGFAAAHY